MGKEVPPGRGIAVGCRLFGWHDIVPHVWRFNERIRIDGVEAGDATICCVAVIDHARGDLPPTYFEFSALAALCGSVKLMSPFWRSALADAQRTNDRC